MLRLAMAGTVGKMIRAGTEMPEENLSSGQNVKNLQKKFVKRPKNTCNAGPGVLYLPMAANGL